MKAIFSALIFTCISLSTVAQENAAPLFSATLSSLEDKPVALTQYRGKPLVVNFWARWCAPCRAEIPELSRFRNTHKGKIEVIGIGIEDKVEAAREFARAYAMDYPVLIAKEQGIPLMQALGNSKGGLPFTLFIDRNGVVIEKKLGLLRPSDLDEMVSQLKK